MVNLWPEDIAVETVRAPVTILAEQGTLLGEKTQNLVRGEVQRLMTGHDRDRFCYAMTLVAPALGSYRYELLSIEHGIDLFPVRVRPDADVLDELSGVGDEYLVASSEGEFLRVLSGIFGARKTRRVISALLAQSTYGAIPEDIAF